MSHDRSFVRTWLRRIALAGVGALGLLAIIGSGGVSDAPECSFFSNVCNPIIPNFWCSGVSSAMNRKLG